MKRSGTERKEGGIGGRKNEGTEREDLWGERVEKKKVGKKNKFEKKKKKTTHQVGMNGPPPT